MTEKFKLALATAKRREIVHNGLAYLPYIKGMEDGFDRVKSGERRPHGWNSYLFPGGFVVFEANAPRRFVKSIKELPHFLKMGLDLV